MPSNRETKGEQLVNQVRRIDEHFYKVGSQSCPEIEYSVIGTETGWICDCPDSSFRKVVCKHSIAVKLSLALRKAVEAKKVIQVINPNVCERCGGADKLRKDGVRHNQNGDLQIYCCGYCGHYFTINLGFEKMHASPQMITSAMQLYFSGESLRSVQKFLLLQGVKVSHVAILKWIRKYVDLMDKYVDKIVPQVSDKWRTDELFIKVKGKQNYLFAVMDDETRFWIAQQVAPKKFVSNIRPMFKEATRLTGKNPKTIISDGASNFAMAINDEYSNPETRPIHLRDIALDGKIHNNKMERLNGELRDREKVMRNIKKRDTPILKGLQIYHNFIRSHQGLDNQTPADKAGIEVKGLNKWITLIQNASAQNRRQLTGRITDE